MASSNTHVLCSSSLSQVSGWAQLGSLLRSQKAEIDVLNLVELLTGSSGELCFQVYVSCWQNIVACSCRTEAPVLLQAVSQGLLLVPRGCSQVLSCLASSIFKLATALQILLML